MKEQEKTDILENVKCLVIKVGSAVLTDEEGLSVRAISRLVDQIAILHDKGLDIILVSSGAVAAGRKRLLERGITLKANDLPSKQAASAIGQCMLMHEYDNAFSRFGKTAAQVLLTRDDMQNRERFLNTRNTLQRLLEMRVIPIINENDTVAVQELKFGDNDTLSAMAVDITGADLSINLTSAQGVFDKNPDKNPEAKILSCLENIANLDLEKMCDGKTCVGTGGMYSKLRAARRVAQLGVTTIIASGQIPFVLDKIFAGEAIGTWVLAEKKKVSHRKFWLAYHTDPEGDIFVDKGAEKVLISKGSSLLSIGVTAIEGTFSAGALVRIMSAKNELIGVGLSNYDSEELALIKGKNSKEIEDILGAAPYEEVIHRDNLFLDAAL